MGGPENKGYLISFFLGGGPYNNKDPTIEGTILGFPIFGKPPYIRWDMKKPYRDYFQAKVYTIWVPISGQSLYW